MLRKILFAALSLLGTFLIVFLSTKGSADYSSFGGGVSVWINETFFSSSLNASEVAALSRFGWKAFGHVLLFLLTGLFYVLFLSCFPSLRHEKAILLGIGLVLAIVGEVVQLFTPTRSASLVDVAINLTSFLSLPAIRFLYKRTR